jgi:hypothetical protein
MGAGKWRNDYADWFVGLRVVLLPDNDLAGYKDKLMIFRALDGIANELAIIRFTQVKDLSEYVEMGGAVDDLTAVLAGETVPGLELIDAAASP